MEKIGVEVVKTEAEQRELEKRAQHAKPKCSHPNDRVYASKGVKYCRQCEKYLEIK